MRQQRRSAAADAAATAPGAERWASTEASSHLRGRRNRDTVPEVLLRRALHASGYRFRLQRRIAAGCTADLVLPRWRVAVFVDGDFWHGCPQHHPSDRFGGPNAKLWRTKIARNRARDHRATTLAEQAGWRVVRVWECAVRDDPAAAARLVVSAADNAPARPVDRGAACHSRSELRSP